MDKNVYGNCCVLIRVHAHEVRNKSRLISTTYEVTELAEASGDIHSRMS